MTKDREKEIAEMIWGFDLPLHRAMRWLDRCAKHFTYTQIGRGDREHQWASVRRCMRKAEHELKMAREAMDRLGRNRADFFAMTRERYGE